MPNQALLAPGARRLTSQSGGVHVTLRGPLHLLDGSTQMGYVKLLSPRRLINELLANELARSLGMQVPSAFVVRVPRAGYEQLFHDLSVPTDHVIGFGSADVGGQPLMRSFDFADEQVKAHFVTLHKQWQSVAHFDCLIANADRHLKNVVVDRTSRFWLIDHDQAFGQDVLIATLDATQPSVNRLLSILASAITLRQRHELVDGALHFEQLAAIVDVAHVAELSWISAFSSSADANSLVLYIEQRRRLVSQLLAAQVGVQMLPFAP